MKVSKYTLKNILSFLTALNNSPTVKSKIKDLAVDTYKIISAINKGDSVEVKDE